MLVTTGMTLATCKAVPLATPLVVTIAVNGPADCGFVPKLTVNDVAVADATVPVAPLLNVTRLLPAVPSKPAPAIVTDVALAARSAVATVTTGLTVATCTAEPLLLLPIATMTVKLPAAVGAVSMVTVNVVAVAAVTVPAAPLLKVSTLLPGVVASKPKPLMVIAVASAANAAVLNVTTGVIVAT